MDQSQAVLEPGEKRAGVGLDTLAKFKLLKAEVASLFADPLVYLKTKSIKKETICYRLTNMHIMHAGLIKGCLNGYLTDITDNEYISQFASDGWYTSDMNRLLNNLEANIYIDAIEDSEFFVYDKTLLKLTENLLYEALSKFVKVLQNNIISTDKRLIHLLSSNAKERYLDFIATYTELAKLLPLDVPDVFRLFVISKHRGKIVVKFSRFCAFANCPQWTSAPINGRKLFIFKAV